MSAWSDLGLPPAESDDYGYSVDAGLRRTASDTSHPRQKQKYTSNRRTFTVSFHLTLQQLRTAENFLQAHGYTWFALPLLSGMVDRGLIVGHHVRMTGDYIVSEEGYDRYILKATMEQSIESPMIVTTMLYPFEVYEEAGLSAPRSARWHQRQGLWLDSLGMVLPSSASWVFTYCPVGVLPVKEEVGVYAPSSMFWTHVQTYFPHLYNAQEFIGMSQPRDATWTYERTHFFYDNGRDSVGLSAPSSATWTIT